jgi:homoserine kinase
LGNQLKSSITKIVGADLPLETEKMWLEYLLSMLGCRNRIWIREIYKHIKAGSGIGSSAASSARAVFGINELLGRPFTRKGMVLFAMQGEKLASGLMDNVAPALLGGFTLVRSSNPLIYSHRKPF